MRLRLIDWQTSWQRVLRVAVILSASFVAACGRREEEPAMQTQPPPAAPAGVEISRRATRAREAPHEPAEVAPTNARPVHVTVLEYGSPAADADVWIENYAPTSAWWHARTRADGRATLFVPVTFTWFRVSASKAPNGIAARMCYDLPPRPEPLEVTLNMTNRGVTITAIVSAPRGELLSNLTVRIRPAADEDWHDVSIARVANTHGPRVVLPPIRVGLKNLRVEVQAPHCAASYSDIFDTLDGMDKEIAVSVREGVRVYGTARLADGSPAGDFVLCGTPVGVHGAAGGVGVVREGLRTAADGAYECQRFIADFYRIHAERAPYQTIYTNLLVGEEGARLDFVFRPPQMVTLRGRVLAEATREPIANALIEVQNVHSPAGATTDVAGAFVVHLVAENDLYARVEARHPAYASAVRYVRPHELQREVLLLLKPSAVVYGTVTYEDGTAATGVVVSVEQHSPSMHDSSAARVEFGDDRFVTYAMYSATQPTGEDGAYVISNVAAPGVYAITVAGVTTRLVQPPRGAAAVSITPGEAVRCDVVVARMPQVFVRVVDKRRRVLRDYRLAMVGRITGESGYSSYEFLARPDEAGWVAIENTFLQYPEMSYDITAHTRDGLRAETNDLRFADARTYHVTLVAESNPCRRIYGHVYNEEHEPLEGVYMRVTYSEGSGNDASTMTDQLGFFDLPGSSSPTGIMVSLQAYYRDGVQYTNVIESDQAILWVLEEPRSLSGRVCLEEPGRPATNFAVGVTLHERRGFSSPDGRFTLTLRHWHDTVGVVYAWVEEYAPAVTPYVHAGRGNVDLGDIVVLPLSSTIRGRVVNQDGMALKALVTLESTLPRSYLPPARSDARDGSYEFIRLPTGAYSVTAYIPQLPYTACSPWFELSAGQTYTVPDLVITTTGAVPVRLMFVKTDGTPAAGMYCGRLECSIGPDGCVETWLPIGEQRGWVLRDDRGEYYAQPFEITPVTRSVRVLLEPSERIAGTVTVDGRPLPSGYLLFVSIGGQARYRTLVRSGRFAFYGKPGSYYAACENPPLRASVQLAAGEENRVSFSRGDATLTVAVPAGKWSAELWMDLEGMGVIIGHARSDGNAMTFAALPAGAYNLSLYGNLDGILTSLCHAVELRRGEHARVSF